VTLRPSTDFVRPGALWTALTIEEYEAMRAHIRGNDFPETTSQWYSLGREAGFGLITKLITSSSIQAFPSRLTVSESSRRKPVLDHAGRRRRKQGFDSPRLQVLQYQILTYIRSTKGNNISIVVR